MEFNFSGIVSKIDGKKIIVEDCETSAAAKLDQFSDYRRPLYGRTLRASLIKYCDSKDRDGRYMPPEKLVGCRVTGHLKLQKYNYYSGGIQYVGHKANIVSLRLN